ncbi:MAG: hypothetical protein AABX04_04855 [Nanoarchaeota archaeon]
MTNINTLSEEKYKNLTWSEKQQYAKEWACTCNECQNKWHYLDSVEKQMSGQGMANAMMGLGSCCNPCMVTATANANTQLGQQIAKLKSCPKCGSSNVTKTAKYFKKQ